MQSKFGRALCLGFLIAELAITAPLAAASVADIVRLRIAGMKELGVASKNAKDELSNSSPNFMVVQISAREIGNAAQAMPGWYPADSGPQPGIKTGAKPEIWTKAAEFKVARDAFVAQAAVFKKAVAAGNVDLMRAEHRKLAASCTTCHRAFRND